MRNDPLHYVANIGNNIDRLLFNTPYSFGEAKAPLSFTREKNGAVIYAVPNAILLGLLAIALVVGIRRRGRPGRRSCRSPSWWFSVSPSHPARGVCAVRDPASAGGCMARACNTLAVLDLFPESAQIEAGELTLGGVRASALAKEFGTPLVVYCEETIRAQVRAYREAAPGALIVYGTKAFANVALLQLLAEDGVGADVSTLGELAFAQAAGIPGERLVFHGNNKSDEELRAAAEAGALVVLDAPGEAQRAAAAGVKRVMVRMTPDVEAVTHRSIQTAHAESKFGLSPDAAPREVGAALALGVAVEGVHIHIGSQLGRVDESLVALERVLTFCRALDWTPRFIDLGGGLGVRHNREEQMPSVAEFVGPLVERIPEGVTPILEPGRSLVGRAGVTLYRVGSVKRSGGVTYAAIDGGMSDNPRPSSTARVTRRCS